MVRRQKCFQHGSWLAGQGMRVSLVTEPARNQFQIPAERSAEKSQQIPQLCQASGPIHVAPRFIRAIW
jgi:hypothetical protein